jgi:hypothetical protein
MPGAFVIDTAGVILLAHRSATIVDNPTRTSCSPRSATSAERPDLYRGRNGSG